MKGPQILSLITGFIWFIISATSSATSPSSSPCSAGQYRPVSSANCKNCENDGDCSDGTLSCLPNYELNNPGTACIPCHSGSSRSSTGKGPCVSNTSNNSSVCLAGFHPNSDACIPCQFGYVKAAAGNSECIKCPIGLEASSDGTKCVDCPAGKYKPTDDYFKCVDCPQGGLCSISTYTSNSESAQSNSGASSSTVLVGNAEISPVVILFFGFVIGFMLGYIVHSRRTEKVMMMNKVDATPERLDLGI